MEIQTQNREKHSEIVIDKMKFEVVDKHPNNFTETDKKNIEHSLYQIFRKYAR
mgnify:CR=1 FL=1